MSERRLEHRREVDQQAAEQARSAAEGINKLTWWLIGALLAVLLMVGSLAGSSTVTRVAALEAVQQQLGERVAAVESQARATETRLARIEAKIDLLLDRR